MLDREAQDRFRVFGKVRLADLAKVTGGVAASERTSAGNRIRQKHVDFVLCHPADLSVVAWIELDDASHARSDRKARDTFLASTAKACGVPLLRFPAKASYTASEVRDALAALGTPLAGRLPPPTEA